MDIRIPQWLLPQGLARGAGEFLSRAKDKLGQTFNPPMGLMPPGQHGPPPYLFNYDDSGMYPMNPFAGLPGDSNLGENNSWYGHEIPPGFDAGYSGDLPSNWVGSRGGGGSAAFGADSPGGAPAEPKPPGGSPFFGTGGNGMRISFLNIPGLPPIPVVEGPRYTGPAYNPQAISNMFETGDMSYWGYPPPPPQQQR